MKKIFTIAAALMASMSMMADVIFSYTLTAPGTDNAVYDAVGGTAKCLKAMASSGSNEITIDGQTFYKFNSSSAWDFTLAEGTFAAGDVVSITAACTNSNKNGKGVTLNGIALTGDFPASTANTLVYTVQAGDAIDGQATIQVKRNDSDIKFGTIVVERENVTPSTDPVESAEISGENACMVGNSVTLTCTASNATDYQWYLNGTAIDGATAKTYVFSATAEGVYSFTCEASNQYNVSPAIAAAFEVTVVDPANACGELIKATHVNKNTATVTGTVGGTADKNTQDNGKLGSNGNYFGVALASGSFMAGDSVIIVASLLNGGNIATIYSDKGTNLLASVDFDAETLTAIYVLGASADAIYVYRTSSACNPNIESITVRRSCEASSNADVAEVRVNGVVVEAGGANGTLYEYTLSALYSEPTVSIALTLAHPGATIKYGLANPYEMSTPEAGSSRGQAFTIVAEDGVTEKTITVNVAKSATLSNNWFLSELSIDGYTLDPAFTPEVNSYTITKPYGAANPTESAIHAVTQHPGAHIDQITINPTNILILVVAEDGVASNGYLIEIEEAAAKKDLLEATFSNGVHGFIAAGNINVPYLAGEAEPTFVSARFWNADGVPTAEMVGDNLVVTGIDGLQATYTIIYVPVTPMEANYEEITFTEVPSYIYSIYGWDASKGVKFSKDVEEATNKRISEGKDRIYIALPAAQNVVLTSGSGANRPVEVTINGQVVDIKNLKTPASNETINFPLDPTHPNFIGIESKGNNGDAGFIKMQITQPFPTAIGNTEEAVKAVKVVENGQLIIMKNGVKYNAQGARLQ